MENSCRGDLQNEYKALAYITCPTTYYYGIVVRILVHPKTGLSCFNGKLHNAEGQNAYTASTFRGTPNMKIRILGQPCIQMKRCNGTG